MVDEEIQRLLDDLKSDNSSGASEMVKKAIFIIEKQLELIKDETSDITDIIMGLSKEIIGSRPSMAPLINFIGCLVNDLNSFTKETISKNLNKCIKNIFNRAKLLEETFLSFLNSIEKEKISIMLISYSSTINALLNNLEPDKIILYVLESRPLLEGQRTAELLSSKYETHLIVDAAVGKFMDNIDIVLIGADSILKNGSIINKIGTSVLSMSASNRGIGVYAVCDSFKFNLRSYFDQEVEIEEKPKIEVYDKKSKVRVHNLYFDVTPVTYIKGIISDLGILSPIKFVDSIVKILPVDWFEGILD